MEREEELQERKRQVKSCALVFCIHPTNNEGSISPDSGSAGLVEKFR